MAGIRVSDYRFQYIAVCIPFNTMGWAEKKQLVWKGLEEVNFGRGCMTNLCMVTDEGGDYFPVGHCSVKLNVNGLHRALGTRVHT